MTDERPKIKFVTTKTGSKFALPMHTSQQCYDDATSFEFDDRDVIISTYPKSGTTWVMNIVRLIVGLNIKPGGIIEDMFPFLESSLKERLEKHKSTCNALTFYHTHIPRDQLGVNTKSKYIWVLRNPKDVCVSFFHHTRMFTKLYNFEHGKFDDYFRLFFEGQTDYGSYFDHYQAWAQFAQEKNVLFLLYEDIKTDARSAICKIAKFLGENYVKRVNDEATMEMILKESSFSHMSKNMEQYSTVVKDGKCPVIRRGVVGDWKSLMSNEQANMIEQKMKDFGLEHYWQNYPEVFQCADN